MEREILPLPHRVIACGSNSRTGIRAPSRLLDRVFDPQTTGAQSSRQTRHNGVEPLGHVEVADVDVTVAGETFARLAQ